MNPTAKIDPTTFADLQAATGDDFVVELVQTFSEETPALLTELRRAHGARAAERFRRAAHSLKGNASTFGATRLAELARTLEIGGISEGPAELNALDALDNEYADALVALKTLAGVRQHG